MKRALIIILFFLVRLTSFAQFYDAGQDAASIKWKQIDTSFFKIVFPVGFENQACDVANYLLYSQKYNNYSLKRKAVKIPILIHTNTVSSNGFVTWSPKRSEWYACPEQDMYAQSWLNQMAIHEYRHVVQVSQMYRGISRLLYLPFGQMGTASVAGIYLPRWFLEGDAVVMETALSKSGRGRQASFSMELKAQLLEKGIYNYNKACFSSYKSHVSDPYTLGYQLVSNARKQFSYDIWDKTLKYVSRNPLIVVPFAKGFKKITTTTPAKFYKETMHFLDSTWKAQNQSKILSEYIDLLNFKEKYYTNFRFPHYINQKEIIALKSGIDDIDRIVKIDSNGRYKTIFTPANLTNQSVCYANNKIVWAEKIPDLRWPLRSYSVLKIYNIKTDKKMQITSKSRYFAPSFNADAGKIAAVEIDENNKCFLVILNSEDGSVYKRITSPENYVLSYPSWNENSDKIIAVAIDNKGKAIVEYNLDYNTFNFLLPFSYEEISGPSYFQNYIIYNGISDETDEILAFDTISKKHYQITTSLYGATDAFISDSQSELLYSEYTSDGYKPVVTKINPENWKLYEFYGNANAFEFAKIVSGQEIGTVETNSIKKYNFQISDYKKISHLFNFHSWAPLSIDAGNQTFATGVSIMSHNLLSTAFTTIGYEYITAEKNGKYYLNFSYKGLFPVLDAKFDYSERNAALIVNDSIRYPFTFGESNLKSTIRIPLKFSTGKYFTGIQPSVSATIINISHNNSTPDIFMKGNIYSFDYRFYAYHSLKMSNRDINPKWGQTLEINFRHSPFGIRNYGNITSVENYMYIPSFIRHHGFITYLGYQKRISGEKYSSYSDLISYPLGTYIHNSDLMISTSLKYYFPLIYPDFSLSSLLYIKRVDMSLFLSKAQLEYKGKISHLQSIGCELNSEMHTFRFPAPVNIGYRFIYLPDNKNFIHEVLFSINFSSFGKK